jgi:hypothetical protein
MLKQMVAECQQKLICGVLIKKKSFVLFQFDGFIDLDAYDTIAMKIKGDGRCYISTVCFPTQELLLNI